MYPTITLEQQVSTHSERIRRLQIAAEETSRLEAEQEADARLAEIIDKIYKVRTTPSVDPCRNCYKDIFNMV